MHAVQVLLVSLALAYVCDAAISIEDVESVYDKLRRECVEDKFPKLSDEMLDYYCKPNADNYLGCWPPTKRNETVVKPCPARFFVETASVNRTCNADGSWGYLDYVRDCEKLPRDVFLMRRKVFFLEHEIATAKQLEDEEFEKELSVILTYYRLGIYVLDSIVCSIAFVMILSFIPSKEKRFVVHAFLIFSCLCRDGVLIGLFGDTHLSGLVHVKSCNIITLFLYYIFLVQVFMMSTEGYYQFHRFFHVFKKDINVYKYIAASWSSPLILVFVIFLPLMLFDPPLNGVDVCWVYVNTYKYTYIIYGPMFLFLAINLCFMIYLMRLIWSKLKSDKSAAEMNKAWRTARGFTILLFLLGGGYFVGIYTGHNTRYSFFSETVQGLQGAMICIFQVFLSKQLKNAIRKKMRRYTATKSFDRSKTNVKSTFQETSKPIQKRGVDQTIYIVGERDIHNIQQTTDNPNEGPSSEQPRDQLEFDGKVFICHKYSDSKTTKTDEKIDDSNEISTCDHAARESIDDENVNNEDIDEEPKVDEIVVPECEQTDVDQLPPHNYHTSCEINTQTLENDV